MNSVNILCQYIFFDKSSRALINNKVMINNRYKNINVTHICLHILWYKYARCHILVTENNSQRMDTSFKYERNFDYLLSNNNNP